MARSTTRGGSLLGPKTVAAFAMGVAVGLVLVAPVLPNTVGEEFAAFSAGAGSVILVGVGTFAVLTGVLAVLYQLYL